MVRCRARCQRTTCFAARVGFCAASFLNFDFPREFASCSNPVLSAQKPWFPQGFSHIGPIALAFLHDHARACLQVLPLQKSSSCALPRTLVSRPVSRKSRLKSLDFPGKTCGFVVEVQDSN